ncbi:hypothetical protein V9T40_009993 [Parthenolecanium corni]|uniref:Histone H2B n=1 Tax=Parthenolecanium corni TaxID=536013 RepID=A0AAN9Y6Z9_9HEMI
MAPKSKSASVLVKKDVARKKMSGDQAKKKRKKPVHRNYHIHIHRVLKQVHPEIRISKMSMSIMNSLVCDIFERIAAEASKLAHMGKGKTIQTREIQTAVRLLLPGELAKHAISEGTKAVAKYYGSA